MKDFILNHKRLTVGIILYIAVFIVSGYISPWQIRDINLSDLDVDTSLAIIDKVPLKIIYFGIYELVELLVYAESDSFSANGLMFFISVCALFSYTYIIRTSFIRSEFDSKAEEISIDFIYDNIFAYISSLLAYYLYKPMAGKVVEVMEGDRNWLKTVTVILIVFFIIIPAVPQILQLLAYVFSVSWAVKLLVSMNEFFEWNIILKTIVIILTGAVLIVLINLIINVLLGSMQKAVVEFFRMAFPAMGLLVLNIIRICIKTAISLLLFYGVVTGLMWLVEKLAYK